MAVAGAAELHGRRDVAARCTGGLLRPGLGGGAIAIPLFAIAGGYALSGRGSLAGRVVCGMLGVAFLAGIAAATAFVGGERLDLTQPRGAWVAVLGCSLLAVLAIVASIPFQQPRSRSPAQALTS